jgi:hypothetical protein
MIYKTLLRKLEMEQREPHYKPRWIMVQWMSLDGLAVPAALVTPVVSLLNDTYILWYGNRAGHQYT